MRTTRHDIVFGRSISLMTRWLVRRWDLIRHGLPLKGFAQKIFAGESKEIDHRHLDCRQALRILKISPKKGRS